MVHDTVMGEVMVKVGTCGIYCGMCPVNRRKEYRCRGCEWVNGQLRQVRDSHRGCGFWECAKQKDLDSCFLCDVFPCQEHYGKGAVYAQESLNNWKDLKDKGMRFGK